MTLSIIQYVRQYLAAGGHDIVLSWPLFSLLESTLWSRWSWQSLILSLIQSVTEYLVESWQSMILAIIQSVREYLVQQVTMT